MSKLEATIRQEDKYILAAREAEAIMAFAVERMLPAYPDSETKFTIVKSVYYDTPHFDDYVNHVNGFEKRVKLRSRVYIPDGDISRKSDTFVELKCRRSGDDQMKLRLQAKDPSSLIYAMDRVIKSAGSEVSLTGYEPVLAVDYTRQAFEDGQSFRITFDADVRFKRLFTGKLTLTRQLDMEKAERLGRLYSPTAGEVIMEVKHDGEMPGWFLSMGDRFGLRPTRFSKYAKGMWGYL